MPSAVDPLQVSIHSELSNILKGFLKASAKSYRIVVEGLWSSELQFREDVLCLMNYIGSSMILLANVIAILLSVIAFAFSVYTLWAVRVSPFKLIVYSPAVSSVNPRESALVLDLTFHNPGRVRAAVLDIDASLLKQKHSKPFLRLRPQAFHRTFFPAGDLKAPQSVISRFAPITVDPGQTVSKTVYFCPPAGEPSSIGSKQ